MLVVTVKRLLVHHSIDLETKIEMRYRYMISFNDKLIQEYLFFAITTPTFFSLANLCRCCGVRVSKQPFTKGQSRRDP